MFKKSHQFIIQLVSFHIHSTDRFDNIIHFPIHIVVLFITNKITIKLFSVFFVGYNFSNGIVEQWKINSGDSKSVFFFIKLQSAVYFKRALCIKSTNQDIYTILSQFALNFISTSMHIMIWFQTHIYIHTCYIAYSKHMQVCSYYIFLIENFHNLMGPRQLIHIEISISSKIKNIFLCEMHSRIP